VGYHSAIKRQLLRPRCAVAHRTMRYGSGRLAFRRGDAVAIVTPDLGPFYVFKAGATADDFEHGKGLLYTYDSQQELRRYVVEEEA